MSVELWLALDVSDTSSALKLAKKLKGQVDVFKIGLELFTAEGPPVVSKLKDIGARIFLDLKLHDIPNTTESMGLIRATVVWALSNKHLLDQAIWSIGF